ncbi:MAG: restriction endonuclease subunit S, partial [Deltaproteobacteria bacterium]|nr:restriction endonuclease subunit S [Deltaproteobacteria bacterium]
MKNNLSEGWEWTTIGAICETASGGTPSRNKSEYYDGEIPWLKSGELNDSFIFSTQESITELGLRNSSAKVFKSGDILIALYGATVGKLGILGKPVSTNQAICAIRTPSILGNKYLFWFLKYKRNTLLKKRIGGAQPNISQQIIRNTELPLPPFPEQHRIIAKIEELFTKLDAGVEALKLVQAQLKRYRQSVLKAAVEGRLTVEWREQNKDELEPADKLLERTQEEKKANLGKKYKESIPVDTSDLPKLPYGWLWLRAETICEKIQDGTHFSPKVQYSDKSYRRYLYVTAKNIRESGVNLSNISYVDEEFHRTIYKRCNVEKNDVLLIKDGVKTGIATVNQLDQEFSLLSSVALL